MPEGDTLHVLAAQLHAQLVGRRVEAALCREPAIERGLAGLTVTASGAVGKNLLLRLSDDTALRVHLGMQGEWRATDRPGLTGTLPANPDPMTALILATQDHRHTLIRPKHLERLHVRHLATHPQLRTLGPDLCLPRVDLDLVVQRARALGPEIGVSQLLLLQQPACGIGNVYKNEALFCEAIHPGARAGALSDAALRGLYKRAHDLLRANLHRGRRSTTGRRDPETWVYERAGESCLRCNGEIRAFSDPVDGRWTWWCPTCQPVDGPPQARG